MDRRLLDAAQAGKVEDLHQLLRENPLVLHTTALASAENPLHISSISGHVDFVKELIRLKPDFIKELNQDGFSPIHMAAANGRQEVVMELLKFDWKLCHLEGRDEKTPLHCAAMKGKVNVVQVILSACKECIEDVTVQKETALHLAVKNSQYEAVRVLVEKVREMKREDVIEFLLGDATIPGSGVTEVNLMNKTGLTALDVLLIFPSEAGDREIKEILHSAGAKRAQDIAFPPASFGTQNHARLNRTTTVETCSMQPNNLVNYFRFHRGRDAPGEVRSALLVIAVLVATATYQVGLSPPGGVWQDNSGTNQSNSTATNKAHFAGQSIFSTLGIISYGIFVLFNSIGFSVSLYIISILTSKFPMHFELQICLLAMFFTYNTAIITISPVNLKIFLIVLTSILPLIVSLVATWVREYVKKITKLAADMVNRIS
ncbi:hypothetical protein PVL29_020695 [Vitis rotundifolia]|uniref:PGG domain-containing protein n=1 Tax=Vitis rotundifolia TaxID=103349 RepID=A0AA38YY32_VITRO|nr:hypothetical protein PVL29_020695 [Vitis rotundifolia]